MVTLNNTKEVHAFDIDGVITEPQLLAEIVADKLKIDFDYEKHLTNYHVDVCLKEHEFINSDNEFNESDFFDLIAEEYYLNSKVKSGFIKYYNFLLSQGHEVIFVTARKQKNKYLTLYFLEREGIEISPDKVLHVGNPKYKQEVLNEHEVTHFYEDNFTTAEKFIDADSTGTRNAYIIDTPYNRIPSPKKNIHRVYNWEDLLN